MRGRPNEVVKIRWRWRWRGASARLVVGKDSRYKLLWVGNDKNMGGAGILLAEKWV